MSAPSSAPAAPRFPVPFPPHGAPSADDPPDARAGDAAPHAAPHAARPAPAAAVPPNAPDAVAGAAAAGAGRPLDPRDDHDAEGFGALLAQVEAAHGFRVRSYKDRCLRRRVAVRMRATGTHRYADYAAHLTADPREYDRLVDALTINVTKLFRNWDAWEALDAQVLGALAGRPEPARVWSAGCATGEEPHSVAALLRARLTDGAAGAPPPFVLGTDVDGPSLAAAARGVFPDPAFADTPPALRARYFAERVPGLIPGWRAAAEVRALVHLARHDLLRDPPPDGPWDLITCRNVVIYFDRAAQEALFERLHAALVPGGVLFLGKVETLLGRPRTLFTPVDARQRIFRRVG